MPEPQVTRVSIFNAQVCVPRDWTDEQVIALAEREAPCGTTNGWHAGRLARVDCANGGGMVHVVLDA